VKYGVEGSFSEGHLVFRTIGKHLGLPADSAYLFWSHVRNGLLHKALPKESGTFRYGIRTSGRPIEPDGDVFWINPFAMRDRLLEEIEPDTRTWKEDDVPLPITYSPVPPR
jgi:hypothetical protein